MVAGLGVRVKLPVLHSFLVEPLEIWPLLSLSLSYGLERGGGGEIKRAEERARRGRERKGRRIDSVSKTKFTIFPGL